MIDTPISETAFIGLGIGAAVEDTRPVVEPMFADFFGVPSRNFGPAGNNLAMEPIDRDPSSTPSRKHATRY